MFGVGANRFARYSYAAQNLPCIAFSPGLSMSASVSHRSRRASAGSRVRVRTSTPQVAVIVPTYQRPNHLRRALLSLELQRAPAGSFEVVVADDGSTDGTQALVERFANAASFKLGYTTHPHRGYHLARSRNEGAAASRAPYLIFFDGDCVAPPDFIAKQIEHARPGIVLAGDAHYLDEAASAQVDDQNIREAGFLKMVSREEKRRLDQKAFRSKLYRLIAHPRRPRLRGCNIGIWRSDYQRVNGFDENFFGWGLEETDLQHRLARVGVRFVTSLDWDRPCHIWHPTHPTFARKSKGTPNQQYFSQRGRLARCRNGLAKRRLEDLNICRVGKPEDPKRAEEMTESRFTHEMKNAEVEILFWPGKGHFTGKADCNVLVVLEGNPPRKIMKKADRVISDMQLPGVSEAYCFPLSDFDRAMESIT